MNQFAENRIDLDVRLAGQVGELYLPVPFGTAEGVWESFGGGEANHAWTSYPAYIFLKYICGIQPTSGGFATFDVRPETGGLTFAEGAVPTVKGTITSHWEKNAEGKVSLSVHVPANTKATIYLPRLSKTFTITESGKLLWPKKSQHNAPGVFAVAESPSSIQITVGAGDYRLRETPNL